jgi:hypothetical protein
VNISELNKCMKVWVAEFLKTKQQFKIWRKNCSKYLQAGPQHWERMDADCVARFEHWLLLVNSDNAELIRWEWVEMVLNKYAPKIPKVSKR